MAERRQDAESVQETAHYSAGCQAATDNFSAIFNFFKGMAIFMYYKVKETRELNEALSELEAACEDEFELFLDPKNGCHKKDRHGEFIPIREFSIDNLNPPFKDQEIVEFVKLTAALTVRLKVTQISPSRPPYPFPPEKRVYKNGSPCPINGSGFVQNVWIYREDSGRLCTCSECKDPASAKTSWGMVHIATAGHVVFDGFEAERTTCYFDFDEDDTDIASIPSLKCSKEFSPKNNTICDIYNLFSYTHDIDFAEKLKNKVGNSIIARITLTQKYYGSSDTQALDLNYLLKIIDCATKDSTVRNNKALDHMVNELNTLYTKVQQEYMGYNIPKAESPEEMIRQIRQWLDYQSDDLNTQVQDDNLTLPRSLQPEGNLVIVVSHPHGCGKYVSLGECASRQEVPDLVASNEMLRQNPANFYEYTAHTCPGSSGGPVYILSKENLGNATIRAHSKFLRRRNLSRCGVWCF